MGGRLSNGTYTINDRSDHVNATWLCWSLVSQRQFKVFENRRLQSLQCQRYFVNFADTSSTKHDWQRKWNNRGANTGMQLCHLL